MHIVVEATDESVSGVGDSICQKAEELGAAAVRRQALAAAGMLGCGQLHVAAVGRGAVCSMKERCAGCSAAEAASAPAPGAQPSSRARLHSPLTNNRCRWCWAAT